jgi:hypothetical protein
VRWFKSSLAHHFFLQRGYNMKVKKPEEPPVSVIEIDEKIAELQQTKARLLESLKLDRESQAKKAHALIAVCLDSAKQSLLEAQNIADAAEVSFYFAVDYGMGGTYTKGNGWSSSSNGC